MRTILPIVLGTVASATALPAAAQSLEQRVAQAPQDQALIFEYAAKPGVCGDGRNLMRIAEADARVITRNGRQMVISDRVSMRGGECWLGPVRIELRGGTSPTELGASVGATDRPERALDLGRVAPAEAVEFLLGAARRARSSKAAETAVFAATLAEGVDPWRELLALARDEAVPGRVRKSAVFWVGQAVSERATLGLSELVEDDDVDLDARETAVFALSQRPDAEAVPALIDIARSSPHPQLRRSAIFWLGQSRDPRALEWFEQVLLRDN